MDGYLRSESEERIANKGATAGFGSRTSNPHNEMEMGEIDHSTYTTTVAGGDDEVWDRSRKTHFELADDKDRIVKTVQLHQYSN